MEGLEFRNIYLGLFAVIPMVLWALNFWYLGKKPELYLPYSKKKGNFLKSILFILGVISWIGVSLSLMGPRSPKEITNSNIEVSDIFFVVDVSLSMRAEDFTPNRLEVAKEKIRQFVGLRPRDRIGIIIFSKDVYTLLPLSTDLKLIDQVISEIKIGPLGSATNIGDALALAVARSARSEAKKKTIVLLTDGVNNAGNIEPIEAARQAKEYDIKVYTIGIGSDRDAKIPVGKGFFGTQYQRIPGGSIDYKLLDEISKMTAGKSYKAVDESSLENILQEIEKLERTKIEIQGQVVYNEYFAYFMSLSMLLFLLVEIFKRAILKEVL